MTRNRITLVVISCLLTVSGLGCNSPETVEERCERVREHLIQLELPLTDANRITHAKAMRRAMGNQFLERCKSSMNTAQHACALDATDARIAFDCVTDQNSQKGLP